MDAFRKAVEKVMTDRGNGADGDDDDDDDDYRQLDCALMASVQKQLTEVADAVDRIRPLADLTDPEKRECAKTSAVKRFPAKSVVFDDDRDFIGADAYFLLEGRCTCVQRLNVCKTTTFGRDRYELVRKQGDGGDGGGNRESRVARDQHAAVHTVYVKMSDLRAGSVFGLGERSSGRLVIATTDVKCLLVPLAFLTKHNASNIWGRTVCSLNGSNPTEAQSFRKFVVDNRWEEYKQSLVDDIFRKHGSPGCSR